MKFKYLSIKMFICIEYKSKLEKFDDTLSRNSLNGGIAKQGDMLHVLLMSCDDPIRQKVKTNCLVLI